MSFFRNLLNWRPRAGKPPEAAPQPPASAPMPAAAPHATRAETPEPAPATGAAEAAPVPEDCIAFPLKAITDLLPPELKPALRKQPSEHVEVNIPRALIQQQLASGAVRITFGQLRAATPGIFFHPDGVPADMKIVLPLETVLRRMMPSRRDDQRLPAIPVSIPSIFAKAGAGASRPGGPVAARGSAEPWYSQRRPTYAGGEEEKVQNPKSEIRKGADEEKVQNPKSEIRKGADEGKVQNPKSEIRKGADEGKVQNPKSEIRKGADGASENGNGQGKTAEPLPLAPRAPAPAIPVTQSAPAIPVTPPAHAIPATPPAPVIPAASAAPAPTVSAAAPSIATASVAPTRIPVPPAAVPSGVPDSVAIPVAVVLPALTAELRDSLNGSYPVTGSFVIPLPEIETRMRSGKLRFKWSQLKGWCDPVSTASVAEDADIDLPLAEVVPLFLAARQPSDTQKKVKVDPRIPDVFGKANAAAPAPAAAAAVAAPAPAPAAAAPEPTPAEPPLRLEKAASPPPPQAEQPAAAARNGNHEITAPKVSHSAMPGQAADPVEMVRRIRSLEGVAGAFLATTDGLLIAGDVADANDNVLAAFAPTVFTQVGKYSTMARLGQPEAIELHLSGATIHVRKAGKLFMGVLMPRGRPVPLLELDRISTALQPHAS